MGALVSRRGRTKGAGRGGGVLRGGRYYRRGGGRGKEGGREGKEGIG